MAVKILPVDQEVGAGMKSDEGKDIITYSKPYLM